MFNKLIAITLLIAMTGSSLSRCFEVVGFELNQQFIAEVLCINKDKPALNCKGKCYLMKKLKAVEEKEKKQELENQKHRYQEVLPVEAVRVTVLRTAAKTEYPQPAIPHTVHRSFDIFQPPKYA